MFSQEDLHDENIYKGMASELKRHKCIKTRQTLSSTMWSQSHLDSVSLNSLKTSKIANFKMLSR